MTGVHASYRIQRSWIQPRPPARCPAKASSCEHWCSTRGERRVSRLGRPSRAFDASDLRVPPRAVIARGGVASYLLYAMRAPDPGGTQLYVTSCPATAASARSALSGSGADASPGTNTAELG